MPETGALCQAFDNDPVIRGQMRTCGKLLAWPSPSMTGVANMESAKLNRFVLMDILRVWGDFSDTPKSPPIKWFRVEVGHI